MQARYRLDLADRFAENSATARQFASNPSDPTSRWAPCPAHSDRSEHSTHQQLAHRQAAGAHPGGFPHPAPISRSHRASLASRPQSPIFLRPARHYPHLWLRTPLGVGPTGLPPASNTASPARNTAASDSLPAGRPLPEDHPVIGRRAPAANRRPLGRGGPPQFPSPPSERSTPSTPGSSSELQFQDLRSFRGLRRDGLGSALPFPHPQRARHINGAAGFA